MRTIAFTLAATASLFGAHAQVAQRTQFSIQLSHDGTIWSNHLDYFVGTGPRVFARVLVSYVANGGPAPLFFNSGRFQPTIAHWLPSDGDTVVPFNPTARIVPDYTSSPPVLGRTFGATTVQPVVAHQYVSGGTSYLRFAEAIATNHPGLGSGTNNVTGGAGINASNNTLSPQLGVTNLVLFTWAMDFNTTRITTNDNEHLQFTIPMEGFRTSGAGANPPSTRSATWVTSLSPFTAVEAPVLETIGATMTINVPAPAAGAAMVLAGMVGARRRRGVRVG